MKQAHNALMWFFWFAFAAFMAASIPHVSYFFRAYEPMDAGLDWWYWTISTAIAISIDITIFLLSLTVASLMRQHKPLGLVFSVWVFVVGLSLLSWYMNYKYAQHFINTDMISATPVTLNMWAFQVQTPDINPILASMFQALSIAYTWISDKITTDEKPKTADELQAEADELERVAKQRQRIDSIKRGAAIGTFKGLVDAGKEIKNHILTRQEEDNPADTLPDNSADTLLDSNLDTLPDNSADTLTDNSADTLTDNSVPTPIPMKARQRRLYANLEDAALATGYSKDYLRRRVSDGKIKAKVGTKDVLLLSSLNEYLVAHKKQPIVQEHNQERNTDELPVQIVSSNTQKPVSCLDTSEDTLTDNSEDTSSADTLDLTVMALEENPDITDEQLADLLGMSRPSSARFYKIKARELVARPS